MTIFGRILDDGDVEDAVTATLRRWFQTELSEVERQHGLEAGFYQRPVHYGVRDEVDKWPEEGLPAVIVISTGLDDTPVKDGRTSYRVPWDVGVACVVSSSGATGQDTRTNTRRMGYRYAAAARASLVHHQSLDQALDGTVRGIDWIGGRNTPMPNPEDDRTIFACRQLFRVEVADVLTQSAGPLEPLPDPTEPHPEYPVVDPDGATYDVEKEPLNG